jgi:hypothetical protein
MLSVLFLNSLATTEQGSKRPFLVQKLSFHWGQVGLHLLRQFLDNLAKEQIEKGTMKWIKINGFRITYLTPIKVRLALVFNHLVISQS